MFLEPNVVAGYVEKWQRCVPEALSHLFDFYSVMYEKAERVVSFKLAPEAVKMLSALNAQSIRILMGCNMDIYKQEEIPTQPFFKPMLQAYQPNEEKYAQCFPLEYEQWDQFPYQKQAANAQINTIFHSPDWITTRTAHLFMLAWFECPTAKLGTQFEGIGTSATERVRFYEYAPEETKEIIDLVKTAPDRANVFVHLGLTLPVEKHPFGFRPIIEVFIPAAQADGNGGAYFEFSNPCPPMCPF